MLARRWHAHVLPMQQLGPTCPARVLRSRHPLSLLPPLPTTGLPDRRVPKPGAGAGRDCKCAVRGRCPGRRRRPRPRARRHAVLQQGGPAPGRWVPCKCPSCGCRHRTVQHAWGAMGGWRAMMPPPPRRQRQCPVWPPCGRPASPSSPPPAGAVLSLDASPSFVQDLDAALKATGSTLPTCAIPAQLSG